MGLLIAAIVLSLVVALPVSLMLLAKSRYDGVEVGKPVRFGGALLVWLIALSPVIFGSVTTVSTKNIGVVTAFNRPTGENLSNGLHFKAPWEKVHEMDGAIQIQTKEGENSTQVRLGDNSMAKVDYTVQWRIKPDAASALYLDYRGFDSVKENLVTKQFNNSLSDVMSQYNPLSSLDNQQADTNAALAKKVLDAMRDRVGNRIEVMSVMLPVIHFDPDTQHKINQFNEELANTKVALQKQATASAEAKANENLKSSVTDPNVLVSKCLDIAAQNKTSPAGCWPGSSTHITGVK
ncbi:band-7-like membrane protein [Gordonia phage Octobien14]|uniref:Band-7-like membrane protein n=1 Tax=Gordonia phage Octobien14 TaxID=2483673 RepID=A0A3G3M9M1_9CAUD|nr:lipoprotein [Gordonia phage Octobien14]AYR03200.1 band-7-like membrane protein [Gordonia phage Octobien14]